MKARTRTQAQDEKRQKRIRVAVSVFLIILMVFSTVGYYFTSDTSTTRYNGHKLVQRVDQNGLLLGYETKVDGKTVPFYSLPADTLSVPLPVGLIDSMKASQGIMFLFDPTDNQTQYYDQARFDFSTAIDKPQGAGVTQPTNSSLYPFPVVSCSQASPEFTFIRFASGERALAYEDGCFVVSGTTSDVLLLRDRILYAYYGITTN